MPVKIAIAIVHGVGFTPSDFADEMIADLKRRFAQEARADPETSLAFQPVFWSPVVQGPQDDLWNRLQQGGDLHYSLLRRIIVNVLGDTFAYQPAGRERKKYDEIQATMARALSALSEAAGRDAPLVVIAHSLGAIISTNFFYDLGRTQRLFTERVKAAVRPLRGPLEKGETLTCFYTLGCPLALWSLRFDRFTTPLIVPSPKLRSYHPALVPFGGWENYYDPDDVLAYPLKTLNAEYARAVAHDVPVTVGGLMTSWNPLSHLGYLADRHVTAPIAARLAALRRALR